MPDNAILMRLFEGLKEALDNNHYVAAVLMDLSKAFDCLPHDILLCKLECYGLSQKAVNLLSSYLSDQKQQVKIGNVTSKWADISKGVPIVLFLDPYYSMYLLTIFSVSFRKVPFTIMQMITACPFTPPTLIIY